MDHAPHKGEILYYMRVSPDIDMLKLHNMLDVRVGLQIWTPACQRSEKVLTKVSFFSHILEKLWRLPAGLVGCFFEDVTLRPVEGAGVRRGVLWRAD